MKFHNPSCDCADWIKEINRTYFQSYISFYGLFLSPAPYGSVNVRRSLTRRQETSQIAALVA